jgi:cellulose synthase/poly-beta-1,6-N-acetylglucosamine synthase-like glycosyltransferase
MSLVLANWLLAIGSTVLAVPVAILLLELGSALVARRAGRTPTTRPGVVFLIPAHNESSGIADTVCNVLAQLRAGDRLLVVADNCSDDTAALARAAGAEVSERQHSTDRGKGYALAHGVAQLRADPRDVVIILDADCRLGRNCIDQLAQHCHATARPVQALDLMYSPPGAGQLQRMSEFAWRIKNHARPRGAALWRIPCPLMGTGMAFPWAVIKDAPLASGSIVEDMRLGADLTLAGKAAVFLESALVTSEFPEHAAASDQQRKRWEHGHLGVMLSFIPRLLWQGITRGRVAALGQALDLSIPPLALLAAAVVAWSALLLVAAFMTANLLWALVAAGLCSAMVLSVSLGWWGFGRDLLRAHELLLAPWYALRKLPMYAAFLFKRETRWIRTERKKD